jgi:hypothetical protein
MLLDERLPMTASYTILVPYLRLIIVERMIACPARFLAATEIRIWMLSRRKFSL